jgi:hypothetical protein
MKLHFKTLHDTHFILKKSMPLKHNANCFTQSKQDGKPAYSNMLSVNTMCIAPHSHLHCRSRVGYTVSYTLRQAEPEGEADITEHHTAT